MKLTLPIALIGFAVASFALPVPNPETAFTEDDLVQAFLGAGSTRQGRGFADDVMGNMGGAVVKQMLKKFLESPIVKKVAQPEFLKDFLNKDTAGAGIFSQETFEILLNSDVFKAVTTPEMFKIVMDSKVAKQLLNKDWIKTIMDNPTVKKFVNHETLMTFLNADAVVKMVDPDFFLWILNSSIVKKIAAAEANGSPLLQTKFFKALANYKFIKHLIYSDAGKTFFSPSMVNNILNSDAVAGMVTPENTKDFLASPVIKQLFAPDAILGYLETKTMKNALAPSNMHEHVYSEVFTKFFQPDNIVKILNTGTMKALFTPAGYDDLVGTPAFKAMSSDDGIKKVAATEAVQNVKKNAALKAYVDAAYKAFMG